MGLFVVRTGLSATPTVKLPSTGPDEGRNVLHLLTLRILVVVVKTDSAKCGRVYRGCVVQVEFARLDSRVNDAHGNGCGYLVFVG